MTRVAVGQAAPDFSLKSSLDKEIRLSDYRGKRNVVLVFYSLDFSPTCSLQLPEYSGRAEEFEALDAVVLAVSRDSVYTHKAWAREYGITVPLLADMTFEVAKSYGVHLEDEGRSTRAVFIIDKEGIVRLAHVEMTPRDFTLRVDQILETVRSL